MSVRLKGGATILLFIATRVYNDIALFMPLFNIHVGLAVCSNGYGRFNFFRFDKLLEEYDTFFMYVGDPADNFLSVVIEVHILRIIGLLTYEQLLVRPLFSLAIVDCLKMCFCRRYQR